MAEQTNLENMIIFKTADGEWGEFSNQYPAPFTYRGIRFETVEQFLYYMRAVFGRSRATADKILACGGDSAALSKTSKKQLLLENNSWEIVRPQMMRIGMRQKFLQNPDLRKKLLSTGFRLLVEMPKEGFFERLFQGNEEWIRDPGKWKGRNTAGKALMQVRTDLRCSDRLVPAEEAYVFPEEPFILGTQVGKMTLQQIMALPGAGESVLAYAETARQYRQMFMADGEDFINSCKLPLVTMEKAIASNEADVELALKRAAAREEAAGTEEEGNADPADPGAETGQDDEEKAAEAAEDKMVSLQSLTETQPDPASEKLPDDLPAEGFYELLYDLDEMMKLGLL